MCVEYERGVVGRGFKVGCIGCREDMSFAPVALGAVLQAHYDRRLTGRGNWLTPDRPFDQGLRIACPACGLAQLIRLVTDEGEQEAIIAPDPEKGRPRHEDLNE